MDKYLYVAMTGASQNALAQKAHANNLANISTNGFQRDLEQARSMPVFGDSFPARAFAMTERPATDFSPGAMIETGRDLDVAVSGDGWMAVQTPDGGEAYVRSASMNVDALGVLRAGNGMPIMGNGGPIAVPPQQKIEVGSDGTISIRAMGEGPRVMAEVDRIKMLTYVVLGVCVGVATVLYVPRLGSASPTTGLLWELEAIASVIVGGTALKGGEGKIAGTVIGAILLSVISNILNLTSIISVYLNAAVQGIVIIIVAFLQRSRR